ncbi:MAG: transglycosylase SLT domain-containing protein, partial [Bdellovibrionota bacterium]
MAGGLKRFLQQSSILILIGSFLSQSALASYDRTVNWADMTDLDLRGILRSEYASKGNLLSPVIADSSYALVMRDADGRVNKDFHIPELLRPNVAFWLDIYTKYTTQHHLLVDSNHPELVYEVLDFRELAEKSRTRSSYEWAAHRLVAKKMAAYRSAFARLMSNSHPRHPSVEEKNILEVYHRSRHRQSLSELAKNIKTQSGQRDNIVKGLLAAETFFPKMEMLFNKMGIPQELTRLSLVESSFDMGARSKVGALGVWQFMPDTGKDYLLMDTRHRIDERLSPLKSTIAAGKLLQWNHRFLGSWVLAVIAYNHGARGLPRVSATRPVSFNRYSKLFDACAKRGALGWASRNYYSEFLAVLYAEAYHHLFYGEVPASTIRP